MFQIHLMILFNYLMNLIDAVEIKKVSNNLKNRIVKTAILVIAIFIAWYIFTKK